MRKNKRFILLFFIGITFFQAWTMIPGLHDFKPDWPVSLAFMISVSNNSALILMMDWYFSFGVISFFMMGMLKKDLYGFGKYMLVRNYNRKKFIVLKLVKTLALGIGFILIQVGIFSVVGELFLNDETYIYWYENVYALPFYILIVVFLLMSQLILELVFSEITSFLIINIYVTLSLSFWNYLQAIGKWTWLIYFFVPNAMFPLRTNHYIHQGLFIETVLSLVIVCTLITILIFFATRLIKKVDIY
ncbi:DUF2705 family protein [Sporolactobacillus kofuensis]|uniref:DUF2705 family protein n=1 Tax=Sporolactobacillus kofuensis TaxID=269672 RepID=A0ABW1WBX8_9BACL|nr:DUF2705 family protein [Sporolactobacillus kofuensis]MCO7175012.1 DUF2705 family protein [Sporolactobacillus kofuensis]